MSYSASRKSHPVALSEAMTTFHQFGPNFGNPHSQGGSFSYHFRVGIGKNKGKIVYRGNRTRSKIFHRRMINEIDLERPGEPVTPFSGVCRLSLLNRVLDAPEIMIHYLCNHLERSHCTPLSQN